MLELLMWGSWIILGVYSSWFFFKAKTFQPLTLEDLALTWKLHKKQRECKASRIHSLLTKNDEVVGFRCDCGYEFLQKRLITQKMPVYTHANKVPLIFSKVSSPQLETHTRALGLQYSCIERV